MDMIKLAKEIIDSRRLSEAEDLSFFEDCDLDDLLRGADMIRAHFNGDKVDLCTIINARSGKCGENCKYCAQSVHYKTNCEVYDFLDEEEILNNARENYKAGVDRFAIVTSGRALSGEEFEKCLRSFKLIRKECPGLCLCASLGLLSREQFEALKNAGVSRIHNNIETSPSFFPSICTSHTIKDKLNTIENARLAGLDVCSGGIFGLGESFKQRIEMALTLSKIDVVSIPINVLIAIKGTPLEGMPHLEEDEILRSIAMFKYINPAANVRLAGGRILVDKAGKRAFNSGASASITGNMLTTSGYTIESDRRMLSSMHRELAKAAN
ncbi:biotin synthase BioB [Lachnospira pectinoschiza]|uniref:Biotin synthase n=1 Tax=Lachnospira pectinoschiza TaxID=28052 RepID=A0A1G9YN66_9FIRM|nr:biotin synthase BioB [Lachnospira pectinoschiza]SDN09876.1 biotin synthase [Lachnospira pectinoschiza]